MFAAIKEWSFGERKLVGATSIDEAVRLANLDFEVEKVEAFTAVETPAFRTRVGPLAEMDHPASTSYETARNSFIIRRTDNRDALGIVRGRYAPVQNSAVIDTVRPLFDQGLVTPQSGDAFDGGASGFMAFSMDTEEINRISNGQTEELFGEVMPYFMLTLSHDGSSSNRIMQIPERISCTNQLPGIYAGAAVVVRHTGAAQDKLGELASELFRSIVDQYVKYGAVYNLLRFQTMSYRAFEKLILDVALPLSKRPANPTNRWRNGQERQQERRLAAEARWMDGSGHKGDHSAWEALNGVIECMDHDELFNRSGGSVKSNVQGARQATKNRLLKGVTSYARSESVRMHMDAVASN